MKSASAFVIMTSLLLGSCALNSKVRETYEADLNSASLIRGSDATPLHRKLFGDHALDGRDYIAFFNERVRTVTGEGVLSGSCHGAVACSGDDRQIRISTQYMDERLPWLTRLSLLIHEARHSEGWPHHTCPAGLKSFHLKADLGGAEACDVEALGAYGVQIVMLKNVAIFCRNCSELERRDAGAFADALLNQISSTQAKQTLLSDLAFRSL